MKTNQNTFFGVIAVVALTIITACPQPDDGSKSGNDPGDNTLPANVTGLTATAGNELATLAWTNPSDTDFAKVEITWTPATSGTQPVTVNQPAATATVTGLTNGTTYTFTVKSVDSSGNKSTGITTNAAPSVAAGDTTPPANVTGLTATVEDGQVTLNWTNPSDTDFAKVEITWNGGGAVTVNRPAATATVTSLSNGTTYTFTVKSVDSSGNKSTGESAIAALVYPTAINIAAIPGVGIPKTGGTPVTEITPTEQYTGTVAWKEAGQTAAHTGAFVAGTAYTATITLRAKTGYTLRGVGENFFTVAGAINVRNVSGDGTITAEFQAAMQYAIGDTGPGGGKIFYVNPEGFTYYPIADDYPTGTTAHYLEAAPEDISGTKAWFSQQTDTPLGGGVAIGWGRWNTLRIIAVDNGDNAASACANLNVGGKDDWFLPSLFELKELYLNRNSVDDFDFTAYYWSSTTKDENSVWYMSLYSGSEYSSSKNSEHHVRAVRAF